jgi:predicted ATPase/DNA-binding winged helix-turn-helix (wHTH) protein
MTPAAPSSSATFGPFTLAPAQQLLLDGDTPVRLGGRAMALLCALVERAGDVLSRDELVAKVWPATIVEETSLRVQVAALRKVLGEGQRGERYIVNVVGRGYSFVAPVTWRHTMRPAAAPDEPVARHNLPTRLTRAIGRDEVIATLGAQIARRRLVSIVGPGGIGKTTAALAVAEAGLGTFEHGVFFVDLAPLSEPQAMLSALLAMLTISAPTQDALPAMQDFLRQRHLLLVFDNCEHLVEEVARLVDGLLRTCGALHVLTTSREPLNVEGEWVHRLAALATPDPRQSLSVAQAFDYAALRLFVERATASTDSFALTDANLSAVRQVCWRLDGLPLAIELAAGRVEGLGVQGLADRLDNVFNLLTRGRRTVEPRHHALKAMLEWSHDLLSDDERKVLRRLSIFRAAFTLEAASQIAADAELDATAVVGHLLSLVDKSLVTVDTHSDVALYRLLYATRKFGELQLSAYGETHALAHRHAQYFYDHLEAHTTTPATFDTEAARALLQRSHEDVDAAIAWSLSNPDTRVLSVYLTLVAQTADFEFLDARLAGVERVVACTRELEPPEPSLEGEVLAAWCSLSGMSNALGLHQPRMFERVHDLIPALGREQHAPCYRAMSLGAFGQGDYPTSLRYSDMLAPYDDLPMVARQAERMRALNLHFMGRQREAGALAQRLIAEVLTPARAPMMASARRSFSMRLVMARILWIQGHVAQAVAMSQAAQQDSLEANPFARCKALGLAAIPIALWTGDVEAAHSANRQLRDGANRHSIGYWQSWAEHFDKIIVARRAGVAVCAPTPGDVARHFPTRNPTESDALPTFAEELLTEQALTRVEHGDVGWCAPETWRVHGERMLRRGGPTAQADAEAVFDRSLALAREQGALSWELRTACSLARLWHAQGRSGDAHALLGSTHARFTEGHATADLVAARRLMDEIAVPCAASLSRG